MDEHFVTTTGTVACVVNPEMPWPACQERKKQAEEYARQGMVRFRECLGCSPSNDNDIRRNQEMAPKTSKVKKESVPEENQQEGREGQGAEGPMHDMGYPAPGDDEKKRVAEEKDQGEPSVEDLKKTLQYLRSELVIPLSGEPKLAEGWDAMARADQRIFEAEVKNMLEERLVYIGPEVA